MHTQALKNSPKVTLKLFIPTVAFLNTENVFGCAFVVLGHILSSGLDVKNYLMKKQQFISNIPLGAYYAGPVQGLNSPCFGEQEFAGLAHASCQNWSRDSEYSHLHQLHLLKAVKKGLGSAISLG